VKFGLRRPKEELSPNWKEKVALIHVANILGGPFIGNYGGQQASYPPLLNQERFLKYSSIGWARLH